MEFAVGPVMVEGGRVVGCPLKICWPVLTCAALALASCSTRDILPSSPYVPPNPPSPAAQAVEISAVRPSERDLGQFVVCMRGSRLPEPPQYYSEFFTGDAYNGVIESVNYDFCSQQTYKPVN